MPFTPAGVNGRVQFYFCSSAFHVPGIGRFVVKRYIVHQVLQRNRGGLICPSPYF